MRILTALVVLAALTASAAPALAQEYGRIEDTRASVPGYFFFNRTGEAVISVTVTGALRTNGRFVVGVSTDLGDLIAYAGGVAAPDGAAGPVTVRLVRDGAVAFEADARALYDNGRRLPSLQDGDVVTASVGRVTSVPGYFFHTQPGQASIEVTAAGAFAAPGRYVLDASATLSDLLALTGGSRAGGERDARTEVTTTVRIYRDGAIATEVPLEAVYAARQPVSLQTGDVVELEVVTLRRAPGFTWRDGLSTLTTGIAVILAIVQLRDAFQ